MITTIRAVTAAIGTEVEADRDYNLTRLHLAVTVPALEVRYTGEEHRSTGLLARLIAERTGRSSAEYQVEWLTASNGGSLGTESREVVGFEVTETIHQ